MVVKTGIKGLDKPLGGGIPDGSLVLLTGSPGTGKTLIGMEFLKNGAVSHGEKGLLVSFEESERDIVVQASQFDWDLDKLNKQKKVIIWTQEANKIEKDSIEMILRVIRENDIKRIVVDSISTLAFNTPVISDDVRDVDDLGIKRFMYMFIQRLREAGVTGLLISQNRNEHTLSIDGVSEFICDGIISVKFQPMGGNYSRSLIIQKMRAAKNDETLHPLEISKKGIVVHSLQ